MTFGVELTLRREERAFERVLGVVGRRGYEVIGASLERTRDRRAFVITLELESDRSPERLLRQLAKLEDVVTIRTSAHDPRFVSDAPPARDAQK